MIVPDKNEVAASYVSGSEVREATEPNLSRTESISEVVGAAGTELSPKAQIVFSEYVGSIVSELQRLIRSGV
jgi:hypothetical protein